MNNNSTTFKEVLVGKTWFQTHKMTYMYTHFILLNTYSKLLNWFLVQGISGGPLINLDGEVVGVHVMSIKPGLAAAVPIDSVLRIMEQFKWNGYIYFSPAFDL